MTISNLTFSEMQNLQISNCRYNKVKKLIFTMEYGKFNPSILNHSTMVIITFHAVLLLTMNCVILTIFFYTSLHGLILPCHFSLCMHVYTCIHVYSCVYIQIYMCIGYTINTCIYMRIHIHVCTCIHITRNLVDNSN